MAYLRGIKSALVTAAYCASLLTILYSIIAVIFLQATLVSVWNVWWRSAITVFLLERTIFLAAAVIMLRMAYFYHKQFEISFAEAEEAIGLHVLAEPSWSTEIFLLELGQARSKNEGKPIVI